MILRLLVVLIGLVLTAQQTFAWHRELQESKAMVDLHKLLHTRQEKIKAFPRLHRSVLATSHEARRCPTDSFVLITEFQYGQAGNQLVEFTHGLWLADKLNAARWGELDLQTNERNQRNEKTNTHKDADDGDYTAIECLFQYLDDPEERLKGFLREDD